MMNLALNSIQAMNHRGDLFLRCRVQDGLIHLEVEDNGSGIDAEHVDQIFEPLFTTKLELGGTGLGLSTVRSIIQRYNGGISVSSAVGNGTCFSISIPLSPEPTGGLAARSNQRSLPH
jgi:signal transduction histidine kinase